MKAGWIATLMAIAGTVFGMASGEAAPWWAGVLAFVVMVLCAAAAGVRDAEINQLRRMANRP